MKWKRNLWSSFLLPLASGLLTSGIALGIPEPLKPNEGSAKGPEQSPSSGSAPDASLAQSSLNQPVEISELGIRLVPPQGWDVARNSWNLSLVMKEPEVKTPVYGKPQYQANITLATVHKPTPIDEQTAIDLKNKLNESFGKNASVKNFQVMEHKFFDYRGKNDGLLVYSSMELGGFPVMQMHVLVSGSDRHFLMTYTDLAEGFATQGPKFQAAWRTMNSLEVTGAAPDRYRDMIQYAAIAAGGVLFLGIFGLLRSRSLRNRYADGDDIDGSLELDEEAGEWQLDLGTHQVDVGDWDLDFKDSVNG